MKKIIIIAVSAIFIAFDGNCQEDFSSSVASARSEYSSGNLENARFALQQSLAEVDREIGREIITLLPQSFVGLDVVEGGDNVSGNSSSYGGLFVHREYGDTTKSVTIDLIDNSPMLIGINTMLAMPMMMNSTDGSQKVVKVGGYKALLQRKDTEQGVNGYTVQVPFNQSLFTLEFNGSYSETEVTSAANSLPIAEISKLTY